MLRGRVLSVGGKICYDLSDYFYYIDTSSFFLFLLDNIRISLHALVNEEENQQSMSYAMKWRQLG
jgi:hypothetical protein